MPLNTRIYVCVNALTSVFPSGLLSFSRFFQGFSLVFLSLNWAIELIKIMRIITVKTQKIRADLSTANRHHCCKAIYCTVSGSHWREVRDKNALVWLWNPLLHFAALFVLDPRKNSSSALTL